MNEQWTNVVCSSNQQALAWACALVWLVMQRLMWTVQMFYSSARNGKCYCILPNSVNCPLIGCKDWFYVWCIYSTACKIHHRPKSTKKERVGKREQVGDDKWSKKEMGVFFQLHQLQATKLQQYTQTDQFITWQSCHTNTLFLDAPLQMALNFPPIAEASAALHRNTALEKIQVHHCAHKSG